MRPLTRLALLLLTTAGFAHAAPIELTASTEGNGKVQFGGADDPLNKANLVLKKNGKFVLGLVGGKTIYVSGEWAPLNHDDVSLRITGSGDSDAKGSGEIHLHQRRNGEFEIDEIQFTGVTEKKRQFTGRFLALRAAPVPVPPPRPAPVVVVIDSERRGAGELRVDKQIFPLDKVHVQLLDNGKAHVHTEGAKALEYDGSWTRTGPGSATLSLRGGMNDERVQGAVQYGRGRFSRVEFSGTANRRYYSVVFEANN
jgi:hypothetical protein